MTAIRLKEPKSCRSCSPHHRNMEIGLGMTALGRLRSMAGTALYGGIIPRQKAIDLALFVASDDSSEGGGQIGKRIDGVELAGLYERGDGRPIIRSGIVARK